jgi:putative colanic acid biosynthesis acetyltransferase WcaF
MDLSRYDNSDYHPGAGLIRRAAWYVCNAIVFDSWLLPASAPKRVLLRWFGAQIGRGVVFKPRINIKYPWNLIIGNDTWIGEQVWIENLALVEIGSNVCISQGAYLLTGNHDYRDEGFLLITRPIRVHDSAWIGAFSVICPGVTIRRDSVLSVRSVASSDTEEGWVYKGSPAVKVRPRHVPRVQLTAGRLATACESRDQFSHDGAISEVRR